MTWAVIKPKFDGLGVGLGVASCGRIKGGAKWLGKGHLSYLIWERG